MGRHIYCIVIGLSLMATTSVCNNDDGEINVLCALAARQCNPPQTDRPTRGKAGPPGPPGPPAVVNYTLINLSMDARIQEFAEGFHDRLSTCERKVEELQDKMQDMMLPRGCGEVSKGKANTWFGTAGLFNIYPDGDKTEVYCDLTTDGGGWTVFQRRMDGSVDFKRNENEYVSGFGQKDQEFWLGLETIHQLTKRGNHELRIDMTDWQGNTAYAKYGNFIVGDRSTNYRLTVSGYSGTAGDSLSHHSGHPITTKDFDREGWSDGNCAQIYNGGWWYVNCHWANLNGLYVKGGPATYGVAVNWRTWKGFEYSLKFTEMKLRKK